MIRGLRADGTAVLLSSHHLDQVQSVCDRVALFNRGRIALSGSVTELAGQVLGGGHVIDVEARGPGDRRAARGGARGGAGAAARPATATGSIASATCAPTSPGGWPPRSSCSASISPRPSLTEVYNRYFEEARHAARRGSAPSAGAGRLDRARRGRRQGDRRPPVERPHAHSRSAGIPDRDRRRLCRDPVDPRDDRREPVPVPAAS